MQVVVDLEELEAAGAAVEDEAVAEDIGMIYLPPRSISNSSAE